MASDQNHSVTLGSCRFLTMLSRPDCSWSKLPALPDSDRSKAPDGPQFARVPVGKTVLPREK